MGKERKVSHGRANTDVRASLVGEHSLFTSSTASTRSHTHKLIVPPVSRLKPPSTAHLRKIDDASSFRPGKIYVRDFRTSYVDEFKDPSTLTVVDYGFNVEAGQAAWAEARKELRTESLRKLGSLAKGKFGNMGNMMRAVSLTRKTPPSLRLCFLS